MYSKIKNPVTNKLVSVKSKEGKALVQKYLQAAGANEGSCINSTYGYYCKSPKCTWSNAQSAHEGFVCYPKNYWEYGSVLDSREKRDAYIESYFKNKNSPIEIQSSDCLLCRNNIFLQIGDKIGDGCNAEIYDIEVFESKKGNKIEFPTPICMKISGINEDEVELDKKEFDIGLELAEHNIGPAMYDYITTDDLNVIPRIIDNLNSKNSDIVTELIKSQYVRLIFMQKLDGYTLFNTHYYGLSKPVLSKKNKDILCKKITKMHKLGYIHNDLHQDNIFIDKKEPYIIDYGYSQKIKDNDGSKANFMVDKYGNFAKGYRKTLGNYITDGTNERRTSKKQYCRRADWTCERGYQGELVHRICKNDYTKQGLRGINQEDILKTQREVVRNNESGYLD